MKVTAYLWIGLILVMSAPLRADSQDASGNDNTERTEHLKRDEKKLERMQTNRDLDDEHTRKAQQEMNKGNSELSGHKEQLVRDVQHLGTVESQVSAAKKKKILDHKSYKDAKHKYGSDDPRCAAAKGTWKESRQAMRPLLESRRTLKQNVHDGGRLVHNGKTVLSVQKRDMDSGARYRAQDDRRIKKKEENIADDRKEMTPSVNAFASADVRISPVGTSATPP